MQTNKKKSTSVDPAYHKWALHIWNDGVHIDGQLVDRNLKSALRRAIAIFKTKYANIRSAASSSHNPNTHRTLAIVSGQKKRCTAAYSMVVEALKSVRVQTIDECALVFQTTEARFRELLQEASERLRISGFATSRESPRLVFNRRSNELMVSTGVAQFPAHKILRAPFSTAVAQLLQLAPEYAALLEASGKLAEAQRVAAYPLSEAAMKDAVMRMGTGLLGE